MYLKKHLGLIGNPEESFVTIHNPEIRKSDIEIECDQFDVIWSLLKALSITDDIERKESLDLWRAAYQISKETYETYLSFLMDTNLLYLNESELEDNPRMLNFMNNIYLSNDRYEVEREMQKDAIAVIGLGTVGTGLVNYALQLGVRKILLMDYDVVERKNLIHQSFYRNEDIGRLKTDALKNAVENTVEDIEFNIENLKIECADDLISVFEKYGIRYAFCCYDQYSCENLKKIKEACDQLEVRTYLSAYSHQTVFASRLNQNLIDMVRTNDAAYVISENSGIGLMGDLGALMMIRLWMQDKLQVMDIGKDYFEYNFLDPYSGHQLLDIGVTSPPDVVKEDQAFGDFYKNQVIIPRLLNMYIEYLRTNDENLYDEISDLAAAYHADEFAFDEEVQDAYMQKIGSMYVTVGEERYSLAEFGTAYLLRQEKLDPDVVYEFKKTMAGLKDDVIRILEEKKARYLKQYEDEHKSKSFIRNYLVSVFYEFAQVNFGDMIDFLAYNPLAKHGFDYCASEQIKMSGCVDDIVSGYDMREYLRYVVKHHFLDLSSVNHVNCNIKNERYRSSDIIVHYENSIAGFMQLCHELGHGYFESYCKGDGSKEQFTKLASETLACTNEFLAQFAMMHRGIMTAEMYEGLLVYLHGSMVSLYSMDDYEDRIMQLDEITWENILKQRKNSEKSIFGEKKLTNDDLSDYNIAVNMSFLFEKRVPYLYPEARMYGFYLAKIITGQPCSYAGLITALSEAKDQKIDVRDLIRAAGQRDMDASFYEELKEDFLNYIRCLKDKASLGSY